MNHQEIERLTYWLWQQRGRPMGSPDDDWFLAEESGGDTSGSSYRCVTFPCSPSASNDGRDDATAVSSDRMVIKGAVIFGRARSAKRRADSGTRDKITASRMERLMLRTILVTNAWAIWS